jgi:hypothetical protein
MLNLSTESKLSPEEVIKWAVKFFGPEGYGLEVTEQDNCCGQFEGGGGGVRVIASTAEKGSTVDIESREWDYQAKEFIGKIK